MPRCRRPALAVALLVAVAGAGAQQYPQKPIRMLAISAPGGGTDLLARTYSQGMADALGQNIVIDNKPGGGGIIATETLAKSQPDGYTILMTNTSHSVLPSLHKKLPYDVLKDFAPVSLVALTHSLLLVHPAKAQPGKLNYASGTTGASAHFGAELLKLMAGINIVQVPYKGTAGQLTALLGNEVQMTFSTMPPAMPMVQAGRLRAIAIGGPKRSPALPEVPTVAESGYPGFDVGAWNGILAPANTPLAIVNRLAAEIAKIAKNPEAKEKASSQGAELVSMTPQEFSDYIKKMTGHFAKVVKATGMRPD
jgi:tripartite-type tricarboxylate transporter receptor subunit TctC